MKLLATIITSIVIIKSFSGFAFSQCKEVKSEETTHKGGNEWIIAKEHGTYQFVAGKVLSPIGEPLEDTLVEVFDKPDYILCEYLPNNPNHCTSGPPANQHRKRACKTGKDGTFRFDKLPAGKYELRFSVGSAWNVIHDFIVVKPRDKNAKTEEIEVTMSLGT